MSFRLCLSMILCGLFLIFLGLFLNFIWISIIGVVLKAIADSYEFEGLLTVKELFLYKIKK